MSSIHLFNSKNDGVYLKEIFIYILKFAIFTTLHVILFFGVNSIISFEIGVRPI